MIVQEIYIDSTSDNQALGMEGLGSGLQVIQTHSPQTAEELRNFLPAMLYGSVSHAGQDRTTQVTGSLVAATSDMTFDLVRLAQDHAQTLHIRNAQGQTVSASDWYLSHSSLQAELYLALFTCRLDPSERLTTWQQTGILPELVGERPVQREVSALDDTTRDHLRSRSRELQQLRESLKQQGSSLQQQLADQADRSAYFEVRQQRAETASRLENLKQQANELTQRLASFAKAVELTPIWQQLSDINAKLAATENNRAHPKHLKRIQEREQRLEELRGRLQDLRRQLVASGPTDQDEQRLRRLLDQEQEAFRHLEQSAELRTQLASFRDFPSHDDGRETIENLTASSARLVEARARRVKAIEEASVAVVTPRVYMSPEPETSESVNELDYDNVRQRITELKTESRELLKTHLLSPVTILGLGGIFAAGVVLILAALLFNFGNSNLTLGMLGVSACIGAILLKFNLERPPLESLQQHRAEIESLLAAVKEQELTPEAPVLCEEIIAPESSTRSLEEQSLETAEREWNELLTELDLAPGSDLVNAISIVELRLKSDMDATQDTLQQIESKLSVHDHWLQIWHRESLLLLGRELPENETVDLEQDEIERVSRCLEDQQTHWQETTTIRREELSALQSEIKQNKRARRKILTKAGADDASHLKQLLKQRRQRFKYNEERKTLEAQIEQQLAAIDDRKELEEDLARFTANQLEERTETIQNEREQLCREIAAAEAELRILDRKLARLSSETKKLATRSQLEALQQRLQQVEQERQEIQIAQSLFEQVDSQTPNGLAAAQTEPLSMVSRWLSSATGEARRVEYDFAIADFQHTVASAHPPVAKPLRELGENEARLILLSLQLAAATLRPHAAGQWPVVIDDDAFGDDAETIDQLASVCVEALAEHTQILVVTARPDVAAAFARLHCPIQKLSEMDEPQSPAPEAPPTLPVEPLAPAVQNGWIPVEYQVIECDVDPPPLTAATVESEILNGSDHQPKSDWASDSEERGQPYAFETSDPPAHPSEGNLPPTLDRTNTPPSRWHRLDQSHSTPNPARRDARQRKPVVYRGKDQPPEWWPD